MTDRADHLLSRMEEHRPGLTGFCYRMLGSAFEADDAVQETMVRAWRALDGFEGRSSLRSWLYRIATNVCFDMLKATQRRVLPMDLGPATAGLSDPGEMRPETTWLGPVPDDRLRSRGGDPAETAEVRESVRLAFVAALQHLPSRQRAVLILCEVLRWKAAEVAELLDTSVAAVNSALQRARAALPRSNHPEDECSSIGSEDQALLAGYVDAFERFDIESLVALLHMDATLSMTPYELWLQGPVEISRWLLGPGRGCHGSRLVPVAANGSPAFGQYRPDPDGGHKPWALQVIAISGGQVAALNTFLDTTRLFPLFGLPPRLDD